MDLTVKDIPPKIYRALEEQANRNGHGVNAEVIDILCHSLAPRPVDMKALLNELEEIRSRFKGPPLTEEFLREAKNWGRP